MNGSGLDLGAEVGRAWTTLWANPAPFILGTLLAGLILTVCGAPMGFLIALDFGLDTDGDLERWQVMALLATSVVGLAVGYRYASLGLARMSLRALRGEEPRVSDLRIGLAPFVSATVVETFASFVARLGLLACCVPGLVFLCAFAFGQWFTLDKQLGPFAALAASRRVTEGSRWAVLALILLSGLIVALGAALAGVGLLIAIPFVSLLWSASFERLAQRASPVRVLAREAGRGRPTDPEACADCARPLGVDPGLTCAGCGVRYHQSCAGARCLVEGCAQERPIHTDWTLEARAGGPWFELNARPVGVGLRLAGLVAVLLVTLFSDGDSAQALVRELRSAVVGIETWQAVSGAVALAVLPWGVLVGLALHEHRAHRSALIDRWGVLLDWRPGWPGSRIDWRDLAGFTVEPDGVQIVPRRRRFARWLGPTLDVEEADRPRLVELLEAQGVKRLDA